MSEPFLILHGFHGSGPGHWQTWLAARLRAAGRRVSYPDLPDADAPDPNAWHEALDAELSALGGSAVVVCHSLSCILWLHHAAQSHGRRAARVLLAAPPSPSAPVPEIAPFFPAPVDRDAVAAASGETRIVCADDDPYCPEGALELYAEPLGVEADLVPGRGHMNPESGLGPWPAVEAWCRAGTVPITA
jgi:predicted alpha/beta hydrolase family esterase